MEGKATLTLTDAKSGRVVKKVTEHNLVTDAVKRTQPAGVRNALQF